MFKLRAILTAPMKKYTSKRQVFKKIWKHFIVDKNPISQNENGCLYSKTGCAIGCLLLPYKKMRKKWDDDSTLASSNIDCVKRAFPEDFWKIFEKRSFKSKIGIRFLRKLQVLHDSSCNIEDFRESLREINERHKYVTPISKKSKKTKDTLKS